MKKIFYNGTIITMESLNYVDAVLTNGGVIERVGAFEELLSAAPDAQQVDLKGRTMLPAFIDSHGHFSSYANAQLQVPLGETASFDEIIQRTMFFIKSKNIEAGEWVVAKGYDHNTLAEKRHPDRAMLDSIAPDNPLVLQHQSGHCGVLNSKALELLGVGPETPAPDGGVIGIEGGELTGYLEETAYIECIKKVPMASFEALLGAYTKAQEKYMSYGITTVQEGMMVSQMLPLYEELLGSGVLELDVVGYPAMDAMEDIAKTFPNSYKKYDRHFKIGGYKIFLDGSPQVKTAWMKQPYKGSGDYCGYGTMTDEDVLSAVRTAAHDSIQVLAHCNGDAAIQQYIDAVKKLCRENKKITEIKPVIIHAQLMTKEQLTQAAALNMIPSFFIAHVLHWGNIHIENFGIEIAQTISPAHTALESGIVFTFHQDAPVIEPNMFETIQCAVTRKTKTGVVLGGAECINVIDALKAVTINAAYQYSEEGGKGSIKVGKQADFVIVSGNPLTVPHESISDIVVVETIKSGETVFKKG